MSVAEHFEALSIYGASVVRIAPVGGEPEDLVGDGGELASAFEQHGQRVLVGVLRDPEVQRVVLADGDLEVSVERDGAAGRLSVRRGELQILDEGVEIPPLVPMGAGPWFRPDPSSAAPPSTLHDPTQALHAVRDVGGQVRWYTRGHHGRGVGALELLTQVPAVPPGSLGSAAFREAHGVRLAYIAGAMAGGIASADLVIAMSNAGLLGFFGAGGLPVEAVEAALQRVSAEAKGAWGFNLLHNPAEPSVEEHTVDLYLKYGVRRVSASAYMGLTPAVVRYRLHGIHRDAQGRVVCPNHVFAKISRPEVAEKFLRPAPEAILRELVQKGALTEEQAALAAEVPVACDVTAEGDSGGHTDHRPTLVLLPIIQSLRDRVAAEEGYALRGIRPRVGVAGGIGTPSSVWAAFAMGADYVLTGSVNQAAVEAGTSELAKQMLAEASYTDVASGPAPDMFEIGAKVQVLARGSMYTQRAQRLYEIYKSYDSIEAIPTKERERIEKQLFRASLDTIWAGTRDYWQARDPRQVEKAESDGRHKMALTFRWYLGMTSRWARIGEADRRRDYQIWCGPAMGGFNAWVRGSWLEPLEARTVVAIADALMTAAAAHARLAGVRTAGVPLAPELETVGVPERR